MTLPVGLNSTSGVKLKTRQMTVINLFGVNGILPSSAVTAWLSQSSDLLSAVTQWFQMTKTRPKQVYLIQVNNYEIIVKFFHISHNLTWYSAIVQQFTRIYLVCSTYELTKTIHVNLHKKFRNRSQKESPVWFHEFFIPIYADLRNFRFRWLHALHI